jgi:hypothetical protein
VEGEADHLVIVLVLFGGSKLPDLAKSLDDAKDGQTLFPRLPRHAMWVGDVRLPSGPSLTPGMACFTGATASVSTAIAL